MSPEACAARPRGRRLNGIQYLRAVAALGVVAVHATDRFPVLGLGVDMFFVLSGFLMVAITDDQTPPGRFLLDRIIRVVPLYWVVTAAMVAVQSTGLLWQSILSVRHIASSLLFIPAIYPGDGRILPLVAQGWTLNYEMLFYTLFAATLLLPRRWQVPALTAAILCLVGAGFALRPAGAVGYTWTHPLSLEFLAGAWVGVIWQRGARLWPLLAVAVGLCVLAGQATSIGPEFGRVAGGCLVLALLIGVLMLERRPGGVAAYRLPLLLGDASYSIYLWQGFALMLLEFIGRRYGLSPGLQGGAFFAAAVVLGIVAQRLVERPLLALAGHKRRYRRGVPIPGGI